MQAPPMFAGAVSQWDHEEEAAEVEEDEERSLRDLEEWLDWQEVKEDSGESGSPPVVSSEELDSLDQAAATEEVAKLKSLKVIEEIDVAELGDGQDVKWLDFKEVYDWRHRDQKWKRRCRIVCREFKTTAGSAETFAPTSSSAAVRLVVMCHVVFGLKLFSLAVKDAFLMVDQQEKCAVKIRQWIKQIDGGCFVWLWWFVWLVGCGLASLENTTGV